MNNGDTNFYIHILKSLLSRADKELLVWNHQRFMGKDILYQVEVQRKVLAIQGVKIGDHLLMARSLEPKTLFIMLAVIANGAIPVLPPAKPSFKKILQLLFQLPIRWIVLNDRVDLLSKVLFRLLNIKTVSTIQLPVLTSATIEAATVSPNQSALVTHSSGSTGKPKAIFRSHQILTAQHAALEEKFPSKPQQCDLPLFPAILLHNLAAGIMSVVPDILNFDLAKLEPEKIIAQLNEQAITSLTGNVFYFKRLLKYLSDHPYFFESITDIGIGGSPVPEHLLSDLGKWFTRADIYVIYGSSEAEPIAIRKVSENQCAARGFCVGAPVMDIDLKIDELGAICVDDKSFVVGEIAVRGKHVVAKDDDAWYRTGDYGYISDENILYLTARKGNERIINGTQHYQLEHVLMNMPGIEHAAAIARDQYFDVYFSGNSSTENIRKVLTRHFSSAIVGQIHFRDNIQVDDRHFSKIIYTKLI